MQAGDQLWSIAHLYYERPSAWRKIAEANRIEDPRRLTPGRGAERALDRQGGRRMTMFWPVYEEAVKPENRHFYAPGFEVKIEGENLPRNVLRDVMELKYFDSLTEIDRFEMTVSNWDPKERRFKFIGSEPADYLTSGDPAAKLFSLFQPCEKTVEIHAWLCRQADADDARQLHHDGAELPLGRRANAHRHRAQRPPQDARREVHHGLGREDADRDRQEPRHSQAQGEAANP